MLIFPHAAKLSFPRQEPISQKRDLRLSLALALSFRRASPV
jgi:hypothetical protein